MAKLDELTEQLKLVSDKTRLTILALLREREMCVCDIVEILRTTQPNVSQHLKKLKQGGLVKETRRSQWIYYSLEGEAPPFVRELLAELPSMKERIDAATPQNCE